MRFPVTKLVGAVSYSVGCLILFSIDARLAVGVLLLSLGVVMMFSSNGDKL